MVQRFILNETSYFGPGARKVLPEVIDRLGKKKALVVTDKGLIKFGVAKMVTDVLDEAGVAYEIFSEVKPNPTVTNVKDGVAAFKAAQADLLIAIGGGSAMDTAKGIGIVVANPDFADIVSLEGCAPTKNKSIPMVALPTTAGTAAETTINYVIIDEEKKKKMVCVDPNDIPAVAIIDAELMYSLPKSLTAATGMDALTHAIEAVLSRGATPLTDRDALWAVEQIVRYLPGAVADGGDEKARAMMAYAEYSAGTAFSNAGLGMVHAMAHALGGRYNLPHGVCNAVLLPYVLSFHTRCPVCCGRLERVAGAMGLTERTPQGVISAVRALNEQTGIPSGLSRLKGVDPAHFEELAEQALRDTCMASDRLEPTPEEVAAVYLAAYNG